MTRLLARELTFEDYLALPEMEQPIEVIDGALYKLPTPPAYHQWLVGRTLLPLSAFVRDRGLGVVIVSPCDLLIRKRPSLRIRQPDIMFFGAARTGLRTRDDIQGITVCEIVPDLAIEVLSEDQTKETLAEKLADYAAIGVPELWMIEPEPETVEVLRLGEGGYASSGVFAPGETIASAVLPGLELPVSTIFA